MPKVSILMPAYNAEKYISAAIESVLKQSYSDWELIIVDDHSDDTTGIICDKYAQIDDRIKVFHQTENQGISKAKNAALRFATGKYIAFCDDDDIMHPKTLEDNVFLIENNNAEIARWSYKTVKINSDGEVVDEIERKCRDSVYQNRKEIFYDYENVHGLLSCDWTGLYSREFLNQYHIEFNTSYRYGGEDTEFNILTLQNVNKMVMNSKIYYSWYLRRNHSTTAKRNINFCYTMIEVARKEFELLKGNSTYASDLWKKYELDYKKLILDYSVRLPENDKKAIDEIMKENQWWSGYARV